MENIAQKADKVMQGLVKYDRSNRPKIYLTTNQIRKFLTAINMVANKVSIYKAQNPGVKVLPENLVNEVQYVQVKLIYQAGRERTVKEFISKEHSDLLTWVQQVGNSVERFEELCRYVEALVAYHKYYGGN